MIQICAPTSNAEEAEVEWFYEDLQDLLELTPKKDVFFIIVDWNAKVGDFLSFNVFFSTKFWIPAMILLSQNSLFMFYVFYFIF